MVDKDYSFSGGGSIETGGAGGTSTDTGTTTTTTVTDGRKLLRYQNYLLRSGTNLMRVNSEVLNFTLIAYGSSGAIETELTFKCLAGTTWAQFVASGNNTADLQVNGNRVEYPGLENFYTITHTQGGTDDVLPTVEIFATTYYCNYGH